MNEQELVLIEITSHRARDRARRGQIIEGPGFYYWPEDGAVSGADLYKIPADRLSEALRIPGIKRRTRPALDDPGLRERRWFG